MRQRSCGDEPRQAPNREVLRLGTREAELAQDVRGSVDGVVRPVVDAVRAKNLGER